MNTVTLSPLQKQVYQVQQPAQAHPRLSLCRVLYVKLLRWLDKASAQAIWKVTRRSGMFLLVLALICSPQLVLGLALGAARWNGYKPVMFLALLLVTLYWKPVYRWLIKRRMRTSGNQHMYNGLPVSELASFLKETGAFKLAEVQARLRIGEDKWKTIANELEEKGVLIRGDKHARVLRPISYENLVRQLAEKFPLVWDDTREIWVDRDGAFARWTLASEFKQRKITEATERAERKLARTKKQIEDWKAPSPFSQVTALSA